MAEKYDYMKEASKRDFSKYTDEENSRWQLEAGEKIRAQGRAEEAEFLARLNQPKWCPTCNRKINEQNRWANEECTRCEGCAEDGMRNFVIFDILSRWLG